MNEIKTPNAVDVVWAREEMKKTEKNNCNKDFVYYAMRKEKYNHRIDWVDLSKLPRKQWRNQEVIDWEVLKDDEITMLYDDVLKTETLTYIETKGNNKRFKFSNGKEIGHSNLKGVKVGGLFRVKVFEVDWIKQFFPNETYYKEIKNININGHFRVKPTCPRCKITKSMEIKTLYTQGIQCNSLCNTSRSNGEIITQIVLGLNNENFETEKTYSQCRDKRKLPFDFYLADRNILIEVQGAQHKIGGREYSFNDRQKNSDVIRRDNIKKEFADKHSIELVEIEYYTSDYKRLISEIGLKLPFLKIDTNKIMEVYSTIDNERWDYEDIRERYLNGESTYSIANIHKCDPTQITIIAKRLGIYECKIKSPNLDYSKEQVVEDYKTIGATETAKKHNIDKCTVYKVLKDNDIDLKGSEKEIKCINNGKIFKSVTDAKDWAIKGSGISSALNGKRKTAGKHPETGEPLQWEYVD